MKISNKAYINSYTSVSCAGNNSQELFEAICQKKETISLNQRYVTDTTVAIGEIKSDKSFDTLLQDACQYILDNSTLNDFSNTLLVVGSSVGGMRHTEESYFTSQSYTNINYKEHPIDGIAHQLKTHFNFYDDISFSTACTSSANALGYAKEVIAKGIYKNVLVVGVDSLCATTVCGFWALSVLSTKPCTPFELNREGMNVSEGIAVLLIQDEKQENAVEICGVGYSSDAHHMTQPHPDGKGAQKAMNNAIKDAKIAKSDIAYINAHGTGTQANDSAELNAIGTLFGELRPYVGSTKSVTGHTLGAAGALEAIIACMVLQHNVVPPSKNIQHPDREDVAFSNEAVSMEVNYVLSNSFAFGGNNTSLVFGKVR
ncbi:MAG: beta-ketoacyl-[acyl-carrier-protein] synthase family protein [Candidatus Marinarcus sp.]|uniref:beta-ketoacyl-[acyl-carrier-protein] synthase family protein n=1 Tax=Candidatus Marinarcus sp. TaxID=3100987 RepID=UPI003AFF6E3E